MRAFLAVPVGEPALSELAALRDGLRAGVDGVRWAPMATAHVTLHFFGSIADADCARAMATLEPVAERHPAMRLRLRGLGCFPSEARPRVLWAGVDGYIPALAELQAACASALLDAGFAVEQRAYRPHCTLGRVRSEWSANAHRAWGKLVATTPTTGWFTAERIVLYESVTGPEGAQHRPLVGLPLGGSNHR